MKTKVMTSPGDTKEAMKMDEREQIIRRTIREYRAAAKRVAEDPRLVEEIVRKTFAERPGEETEEIRADPLRSLIFRARKILHEAYEEIQKLKAVLFLPAGFGGLRVRLERARWKLQLDWLAPGEAGASAQAITYLVAAAAVVGAIAASAALGHFEARASGFHQPPASISSVSAKADPASRSPVAGISNPLHPAAPTRVSTTGIAQAYSSSRPPAEANAALQVRRRWIHIERDIKISVAGHTIEHEQSSTIECDNGSRTATTACDTVETFIPVPWGEK